MCFSPQLLDTFSYIDATRRVPIKMVHPCANNMLTQLLYYVRVAIWISIYMNLNCRQRIGIRTEMISHGNRSIIRKCIPHWICIFPRSKYYTMYIHNSNLRTKSSFQDTKTWLYLHNFWVEISQPCLYLNGDQPNTIEVKTWTVRNIKQKTIECDYWTIPQTMIT